MPNLSHGEFKAELADGLSDLAERMRRLDGRIRTRLDSEPKLCADKRERLADLQENLRAPQNYFNGATSYVRRWL
jgi:hypothetical protein